MADPWWWDQTADLLDEVPVTVAFIGLLEPDWFQFAGFDDQCYWMDADDSLVWDMVAMADKLSDGNLGASRDIDGRQAPPVQPRSRIRSSVGRKKSNIKHNLIVRLWNPW